MKSAQELAEEYLGKDFPEAFGSNAWILSKHAYIVGYEAGRASLEHENAALRGALEKIADPRKRDHKEPDAQTEVYCLMHIANEALGKGEKGG